MPYFEKRNVSPTTKESFVINSKKFCPLLYLHLNLSSEILLSTIINCSEYITAKISQDVKERKTRHNSILARLWDNFVFLNIVFNLKISFYLLAIVLIRPQPRQDARRYLQGYLDTSTSASGYS
jgi:hypothetical protein